MNVDDTELVVRRVERGVGLLSRYVRKGRIIEDGERKRMEPRVQF